MPSKSEVELMTKRTREAVDLLDKLCDQYDIPFKDYWALLCAIDAIIEEVI